MTRLDPAVIRLQIHNLELQHPEVFGDEELKAISIESETDAFEYLRTLARMIGEREAHAAGTSGYIQMLQARKKRLEDGAEGLREMALTIMQAAGIDKAQLPEATVSVGKAPAKVIITDVDMVPDIFCKHTRTPDKDRIKNQLKDGYPVAGAVLSNGGAQLSIRVK